MVNFGPLAAEISWQVWCTPANFNKFRVLTVLLHGTVVVGISQTLRRWAEGATYIRQSLTLLIIQEAICYFSNIYPCNHSHLSPLKCVEVVMVKQYNTQSTVTQEYT